MEELLKKLDLPTEGETYPDYKARMHSVHGSEGQISLAIKIKYSTAMFDL